MLNIKELILGILAAGTSVAVFYFWQKAAPLIVAGEFREYATFIVPVAGLVVAGAFFALLALFIKDKRLAYLAAIAAVAAPYFFLQASAVVAGTLAVSILLIAFALHRIRKEFTLSLGFSLTKTLKSGLPLYFTVAALLVSVFYLANLDEEKAISTLLPKTALNTILVSLSGQLPQLLGLPAGISIDPEMIDILYSSLVESIQGLLGPYREYLPAVSALVFFFAFKAFTLPLYYASLLITFLLIKLLLLIKILKSEKRQIEAERLTL